jgi:cell wall-associated NlpC family hydrolase
LAQEVNWRAFMDRGTLYFVSEDRLISAKARYIVSEQTDGVSWIDFDIDQGKKVSEATVTARTDLFDVPIGSVMAIREMGTANGRYLVAGVRRGLFDADTEIALKRATPKLKEPDTTVTGGQGDENSTGVAGGSLRDKIVSVAEASRKNYEKNKGAWFYSQTGAANADDPTRPPKAGRRSDCSQWVAAVYKKAGAPPPCSGDYATAWTGNMKVKGKAVGLSDLKPGDVVIYGAGSGHHVELYVGPGNRTIGHGSPPVDYGTTTMQSAPQGWRYDFLDK